MGMDQRVTFTADKTPTWDQLARFLAARQYPLQLRMIDGELAFPDEMPTDSWRELRVSTPGGMVTLRREPDGVTLVTWGNADAKMQQAWNTLAWALAHLSGGAVGSATSDEFRKTAALPDTV